MNDNLMAPGLPPPDTGSTSSSPPIGTLIGIGALVVAALGFALFGISYALGWWAGDDEAPEQDDPLEQVAQAEPTPDPDDHPPAPTFAGAELTPEVDPSALPSAAEAEHRILPGLEPVPEVEAPIDANGAGGQADAGSGDSADTPSRGAGARSTGPRVSVTLILGHYEHVDVKLGGMVLSLDADKTVKIRPGGYRIELRAGPDAPWKPAGLLDIQVGSSYRVTLLDPPFAKLEIVQ